MGGEGTASEPAGKRPWGTWLLFGAAYLALAVLSDDLSNDSTQFATFWPAAGLYMGALLLAERRWWTGFVVAAALADVAASLQIGRKPVLAIALVAGDALEAVGGATMVLAAVGGRPRMSRLRDLVLLVLLGAILAPLVPGLLGGLATEYANGAPLLHAWTDWWTGDALGILVVTPLLLAWRAPDPGDRNHVRGRPLEFAALLVVTLGVSWAVFREATSGVLRNEYLVLPPFVWAALRFGPRGATAVSIALATAASSATAWASQRGGPDALAPDEARVQFYLALAIGTALALAAEVAGRERSERRLQLARYALDQGADAILVADASGRITLANEAAARLLGSPVAELVGAPIERFDPALAGTLGREGWKAFQARGPSRYETHLVVACGRSPPAEVSLAFLSFDGAGFLAWSGRDVSERLRLEEEHRLAAVGTLASGVAHEINNPLTYVTSNLAFVEETLVKVRGLHPDVKEAEEAAAEAALGARRVRDIVRDLRFVARPPDARRIEIDPVVEIRSSVTLAQAEINRRARLELGLEPCPAVLAGQGRIGQVMLHLLVNAAQSIPPGAQATHVVRVGSRTDGDGWACIEVSDTGGGIPAAVRRRVFEPFFSTRPVGGGTGLGLALSKGIVGDLGGTIEVSGEEGHGTTVRVRLPPASLALPAET